MDFIDNLLSKAFLVLENLYNKDMITLNFMKTITLHFFILIALISLSSCSQNTSIKKSNQDSLSKQLIHKRVVLVGETHTDYGHHLNQLAVIQKSHKKWGGVISIGLEMVQQPFQSYLDDYVSDKISELEMLRRVEWYSRWRYDFRLYRPIFEYAKKHKIPLIALNIPRELTKRVSKVGFVGLNPQERKYFPKFIDKSNSEYKARLRKIFAMHAHGKTFNEKGFNKFVDAQLAWDEGMAFAASNNLTKHPKRRMVILAGSGHLINRHGIPNRLDREMKLSGQFRSLVILSHSDDKYTSKEADISLPTKYAQLPPAGQIGIGMKKGKQGVLISSISKKGAAVKAGLQQGDIIVALDSNKIEKPSDVYLWLLDKKPKQMIKIEYRRIQQILTKEFLLESRDLKK